jgi:hypothetical protein
MPSKPNTAAEDAAKVNSWQPVFRQSLQVVWRRSSRGVAAVAKPISAPNQHSQPQRARYGCLTGARPRLETVPLAYSCRRRSSASCTSAALLVVPTVALARDNARVGAAWAAAGLVPAVVFGQSGVTAAAHLLSAELLGALAVTLIYSGSLANSRRGVGSFSDSGPRQRRYSGMT